MLLGVRDLLIKQRTAVINTIRGYAAEFGVIAAKGPVKVAELLQQAHAEEASVPALALDMLRLLAGQLDALDVKLKLIGRKPRSTLRPTASWASAGARKSNVHSGH